MINLQIAKKEIVDLSHFFYGKGWSSATSSNYSARLSENKILVTSSGKDKSKLSDEDLVIVDYSGTPLSGETQKPSAETLLHCQLYQSSSEINVVLHTHSVYGTILSDYYSAQKKIQIENYEMVKSLKGITTHETTLTIPIFENTQNMQSLCNEINRYMSNSNKIHAYLISGHGLYLWGSDFAEAKRHVEGLEFLFECEYKKLLLKK